MSFENAELDWEKFVAYRVFESFGFKNPKVEELEYPKRVMQSYYINTEGKSIDYPDFSSIDSSPIIGKEFHPYFFILSHWKNTLRLDFCIELTFIADYIVALYMDDGCEDLGVYFIKPDELTPMPVEFGAILHESGNAIFVENFGTVKSGEIFDRAVAGCRSNLHFAQYFDKPFKKNKVWVDEFHLNNIMDLRLYSDGYDTYADGCRFATSIEELDAFMNVLEDDKTTFRVIINTHEVKIKTVADAADEFEHSQSYWRSIYESLEQ